MILALLSVLSVMAQRKSFTLEELNSGGSRYHEMTPEKRYYTWWGDELLRVEVDGVHIINKVSGKEKPLFSLDDILDMTEGGVELIGINLLNAAFPYKDKSLVCLDAPGKRVLYDFKAKRIAWSQARNGSLEWNDRSRVDAFSRDNNLWIRLEDGTERQLTEDGSTDIV